MQHVALMMTRNERDVIAESLPHHVKYFETIVAQDGSIDGTREVLSACPQVVKLIRDEDVLRPGDRWCDAHRNVALQWILDRYGAEDVWVTLLHADEFWWDDPIRMAYQAQCAGATHVMWGEFRFFLHEHDRPIWPILSQRPSLLARLGWYCGPFYEIRQFNLRYHQVYKPGQDHCVLPCNVQGEESSRRWERVPRYRHYPYRSPEQVRRAYMDKILNRYWQPDHHWLETRLDDPFVSCLPRPNNSPLVERTWNQVRRFDGDLPDPAQFLPDWWDE